MFRDSLENPITSYWDRRAACITYVESFRQSPLNNLRLSPVRQSSCLSDLFKDPPDNPLDNLRLSSIRRTSYLPDLCKDPLDDLRRPLIHYSSIVPNRYGWTTSDGIRPGNILPEQNRAMEFRLGIDRLPTPTMKAHAVEAQAQLAQHFHTNRTLFG